MKSKIYIVLLALSLYAIFWCNIMLVAGDTNTAFWLLTFVIAVWAGKGIYDSWAKVINCARFIKYKI